MYRSLILCLLLLPLRISAQTMSFDPSRGLVEVDVMLNDSIPATFALDTGADWLMLGLDFAMQHRLLDSMPLRPAHIVGLAGQTRAARFELESLTLGGLRLQKVPAAVLDLWMLNSNNTIAPPDGVLGYELLHQYAVTIDPSDSTVTFSEHYEPREREIALPFCEQYHLVPITVTYADSLELVFILDLGSTHTLLSESVIATLDLSVSPGGNTVLRDCRLGGMAVDSLRVKQIDLAPYQQEIPRLRIDGILGWSFLQHYRVTIDYRASRAWLGETEIKR